MGGTLPPLSYPVKRAPADFAWQQLAYIEEMHRKSEGARRLTFDGFREKRYIRARLRLREWTRSDAVSSIAKRVDKIPFPS